MQARERSGLRIGIFGGSFDPVHHGHLILARDAVEQLELDRLIFVPAARSPHKAAHCPAPAHLRLAMLEAAIRGEPGFELDDFELRRGEPSFTIDTVVALRQRWARADFFCLIGEDNLPDLHTWHCFDQLQALVRFVVLGRGTTNLPPHPYPTIRRQIEISATTIRARVASGLSIRYLLPEAVRDIIETHQLYREAQP